MYGEVNGRPASILAPVASCKASKPNPYVKFDMWSLWITPIVENVEDLTNSDILQHFDSRLRCFRLNDPVEHALVLAHYVPSQLLKFIDQILNSGLRRTIMLTENITNFMKCNFYRSTIFIVDLYYFSAIFKRN